MPVILTPALASLCLDVAERRRSLDERKFTLTILEEALLIQQGLAPPVYRPAPKHRRFQSGLRRPNWKHDKGSR
jgi:hypothetical protein